MKVCERILGMGLFTVIKNRHVPCLDGSEIMFINGGNVLSISPVRFSAQPQFY